ncbi:MAG: hypothetical protein Q9193_001681 [Seirophora villosa]
MKNAYRVGLYGDDPKVKDGTWRELFDDNAEGPTEGKKGPTMEGQTGAEDGEGVDAEDMDLGVDQDEREAAHGGGENKGGDKEKTPRGGKRKRGQGTLDGHFESPRKRKGKARTANFMFTLKLNPDISKGIIVVQQPAVYLSPRAYHSAAESARVFREGRISR